MLSAFFSATYSSKPPSAHLLVDPVVVLRALAVEAHQRDAVAARVGDALDLDADHRAHRMLRRVEPRRELLELRIVRQRDRRAAVQPHDPRRPVERAEHHDDAPVLARVRDRLGAAPDEVEVRDLARPEDAEPAQVALRRDVDVPVLGERRRRDEEEVLALHPGAELLVDLVVDLAHATRVACARMERVLGIGGVFFRSERPDELRAWYAEHLGLELEPYGGVTFRAARATSPSGTRSTATRRTSRPSRRRCSTIASGDLDAMLAQLRAGGVEVKDEINESELRALRLGDGSRGPPLELWQPPPDVYPEG